MVNCLGFAGKAFVFWGLFLLFADLIRCENYTFFYRASGIIMNRNYSSDLADKESISRKNLSTEIFEGFKAIYELPKIQESYMKKEGQLLNVTTTEIYFCPPSQSEPTNTSLIQKERTKLKNYEVGIYFLMILQLDFHINQTNGNTHHVTEIAVVLKSLVILYLQRYGRPAPFWLTSEVFLNSTLQIERLPATEARRMVDVLKYKNHFTSKILHQNVISEKNRDVLSILSYVGCGLSLFGLTLTIITIMFSRKLRRMRANQILVQMCLALLGALLFYSFGIRQLKEPSMIEMCKAISALLHYFILASMIWASIEAYNLYQDLVKVFDTSVLTHTEFMCRASLIGWVPPSIIVGTTVLVSDTSYQFQIAELKENNLCWLRIEAFYGALLAPVLLLVLGNIIIFVIVMREIFKMPQAQEKHSKLSQFRATISVFTLLGLNWIFAGLASASPALLLQYLFTITCSFQGFLIFVLHGILKKDFQEAWKLLSTKNRVMEKIRSSHISHKTNSSSLSNVPSNSMAYSQETKFDRMSNMDSGITA